MEGNVFDEVYRFVRTESIPTNVELSLRNAVKEWKNRNISYASLKDIFNENNIDFPSFYNFVREEIKKGYNYSFLDYYPLLNKWINYLLIDLECNINEIENMIKFNRLLDIFNNDDLNYCYYRINKTKSNYCKWYLEQFKKTNRTKYSLPMSSLVALVDKTRYLQMSKKDAYESFVTMCTNNKINKYDMRYCLGKLGFRVN